MNIKYAEAFEQIKSLDNLIEVFKYYGQAIEKKYNVLVTKCVFHNDNNPSMSLYDFGGTGLYKCLGCGEKGNVITFVKRMEGVETEEALIKIFNILNKDLEVLKKASPMTEEEWQEIENKRREKNKILAMLHETKEICLEKGETEQYKKIVEAIEAIRTDNLKVHLGELINHAIYKANITVDIDRYINEDMTGIEVAFEEAQKGKRVLLISPTGSGKNYTVINYLKGDKGVNTVLVGPNTANIEQTVETYDIPGAFGNKNAVEEFNKDCKVKAYTWDKMIQLKEEDLSEHILLLDEADQMFRDLFREKAIKGFNDVAPKFKGRIDMTATPSKIDFSQYDCIIEYKQKTQTNYIVQMYNGVNEDVMLDIINKSKAFGMLYNNIDFLEVIDKKCDKKTDVISADKKNTSKLYDLIMKESSMGDYEGCLNTSAMIAGVNIHNPNITDIIVVDIKDIGTIKQYVARYRGLKEVRVHIFANYSDEAGVTYNVEKAIKKEISQVEEEVFKMNMELLTDEIGYKAEEFNLSPMKTSAEKVYRDMDAYVYKVNYSSIRGNMYNRYYTTRNANQHRILLSEQFNNINEEIIDVDAEVELRKDLKELKMDKKEAYELAINTMEKHRDKMVGYCELMLEDKISTELEDYFKKNEIESFLRIVELDELDMDKFFSLKKVKEQNKIFTKYVVDYGYNIDFAWNMSTKSKQTRTNIYSAMNLLAYRYFKQNIPCAINTKLQEVKLYEAIESLIGEAKYYTKEGIKELSNELKKEYRAWNYSDKEISTLIKTMYVVKEEKKSEKDLDNMSDKDFLLGKRAEKKPGKRSGMIKIENIKNIDNLKKELAVPNDDYTIENFINGKIKQYIKLLPVDKKQELDIYKLLLPTE